jgi:pyridoxal 5'-phosphate synthase pdxS subunit
VGSGIFGEGDPVKMANAIVEAANNWDNKEKLAQISTGIGKGMKGEANIDMPEAKKLQGRGI